MTAKVLQIFFFFCFVFIGCAKTSSRNVSLPQTKAISESNILKREEKSPAELPAPKNNPIPEPLDGKSFENIKISAEIVATIDDGDFVLPVFSPDGKKSLIQK